MKWIPFRQGTFGRRSVPFVAPAATFTRCARDLASRRDELGTAASDSHAHSAPPGLGDRQFRLAVWAFLGVVTYVAHGPSLEYGYVLDDHWHQAKLRDMGWSLSELLEATTIEPQHLLHIWWQERPLQWRYCRPVSVLLMKAVHEAFGGSAAAHHAVSLVLHFASACMLHHLCVLLTRHRFWSVVGALSFVVYSHSVFAVGWLAAQNAVLQTTLMLGAMLLYIRASRLDIGPESTSAAPPHSRGLADYPVPPLRHVSLALALAMWVLAVLSRETAVMLPAVLLALDLAFGGTRHAWARRFVHLLTGVLAVAFLIWRVAYYHHPIPEVYVRRWDGWGYFPWLFMKLVHYVCCAVWHAPMVIGPTGRQSPIREVPGDCLLMLTILAIMATAYYQACRRARGYWIWPLWLLLAVLPVAPVMATPHSGYLCGVGYSVAMVLGPGRGAAIAPCGLGRWCRPAAVWFLIATCTYVPIYHTLWRSMMAAERLTVAEVAADPPPQPVTDVFFINLPFVNIYARQCLLEAQGGAISDVRLHVLTFSPHLLGMDDSCIIRQHDARSFSISVSGNPYYSGLLGRFLIDAMKGGGPFRVGQDISTDRFHVRVVRADEEGVRELKFTFFEPLQSETYRFYLTTAKRGALPVRFPLCGTFYPTAEILEQRSPSLHNAESAEERLCAGELGAADVLFTALRSDDPHVRRRSWAAFTRVARPIAQAIGSPLQEFLRGAEPPEDASQVVAWWRGCVDERLIESVWVRRADFAAIRWARDGLSRIRAIAARVIRSDLYMTGPPYKGPAPVAMLE